MRASQQLIVTKSTREELTIEHDERRISGHIKVGLGSKLHQSARKKPPQGTCSCLEEFQWSVMERRNIAVVVNDVTRHSQQSLENPGYREQGEQHLDNRKQRP